jgi:hypothetical protein
VRPSGRKERLGQRRARGQPVGLEGEGASLGIGRQRVLAHEPVGLAEHKVQDRIVRLDREGQLTGFDRPAPRLLRQVEPGLESGGPGAIRPARVPLARRLLQRDQRLLRFVKALSADEHHCLQAHQARLKGFEGALRPIEFGQRIIDAPGLPQAPDGGLGHPLLGGETAAGFGQDLRGEFGHLQQIEQGHHLLKDLEGVGSMVGRAGRHVPRLVEASHLGQPPGLQQVEPAVALPVGDPPVALGQQLCLRPLQTLHDLELKMAPGGIVPFDGHQRLGAGQGVVELAVQIERPRPGDERLRIVRVVLQNVIGRLEQLDAHPERAVDLQQPAARGVHQPIVVRQSRMSVEQLAGVMVIAHGLDEVLTVGQREVSARIGELEKDLDDLRLVLPVLNVILQLVQGVLQIALLVGLQPVPARLGDQPLLLLGADRLHADHTDDGQRKDGRENDHPAPGLLTETHARASL